MIFLFHLFFFVFLDFICICSAHTRGVRPLEFLNEQFGYEFLNKKISQSKFLENNNFIRF